MDEVEVNRIKNLRSRTGLSQARFSEVTGIPLKTLQHWEAGRRTPPPYVEAMLEKTLQYEGLFVDERLKKEAFQTFRDNLHHRLKRLGDLECVLEILKGREIDACLDADENAKALYLLAFTDYLLKKHDEAVPIEYAALRGMKLEAPLYVGDSWRFRDSLEFIPEFVHHNIYEGDLYDAV